MKHRRLWLSIFAVTLLLPACSSDTAVFGPEAPPVQMNVQPKVEDERAPDQVRDQQSNRFSRYAMAAS